MKKVVPNDAVLVPDNAKRVFEGQIFDVYQWPQNLFDGSVTTFEMLRRADTAVIIGIDQDKILVIDDRQPTTRIIKFPGGKVEADDPTVEAAAQRELLEEVGYTFADWKLVKVDQPEVKIERFVYIFVASGVVSRVEPQHDAGERIEAELLPFNEVKQLALESIGYVGRARDFFDQANSCDDLLALPEFKGAEVDR